MRSFFEYTFQQLPALHNSSSGIISFYFRSKPSSEQQDSGLRAEFILSLNCTLLKTVEFNFDIFELSHLCFLNPNYFVVYVKLCFIETTHSHIKICRFHEICFSIAQHRQFYLFDRNSSCNNLMLNILKCLKLLDHVVSRLTCPTSGFFF